MKMTKREKIMISLLVVTICLYGYYRFLLTPQLAKLQETEVEKTAYDERLAEYNSIASLEKQLDEDIQEMGEKMKMAAINYFPSLHQEELILLIKDFLKDSDLTVPSLAFSQPREETLGEATIDAMQVNLSYDGNYTSLNSLLERIWKFQKKIIVKSFNTTSKEDDFLAGNISLDFYHLPSIEMENEVALYDWYLDQNTKKSNPFRASTSEGSYNYIYRAGDSMLLIDRRYQPFEDIQGHWAEKEIDDFGSMYYIRGDRNNNYQPDESMTRGEFILLLDMVFNWTSPEERVDLTEFTDYENLGSYENSIAKAIYKGFFGGFLSGYTDKTLRPQSPMTYEEVELVMRKVLEEPNFQWQQVAEKINKEKGIYSVGMDSTGNYITKADAIYFLYYLR